MITLYKRGRVWWVRGSFSGQRLRRQSLDTTDKRIAELKKVELEKALADGLVPMEWPVLATEFLRARAPGHAHNTKRKYRFLLGRFGRFLQSKGVRFADSITPAIIGRYAEERRTDIHPTRRIAVGPEGIKSDLRLLRAVFGYAVAVRAVRENPVRVARLGSLPANTQPFSDEELITMLNATPHEATRTDLRAIILTFVFTGLRISDVIGLRKASVEFDKRRIITTTQKRKRTVTIPMHADLVRELVRHFAAQRGAAAASPLVFPTRNGKPTVSLDAILRRFWRSAGLNGARAHRFRDTFSVKILEQGGSLNDVAQLLGITEAVAARYYSPYVTALQERARRLVDAVSVAQLEHTTF